MSLTGKVPAHPAEFSPEVIVRLRELLHPGERVHDPFAGRGLRLGKLCDEIGSGFTGTDIEVWEGADPRVYQGDSTTPGSYPIGLFTVVTSPVYLNRISTDYVNGPTENTKRAGRHAYGISLGRALHSSNLARLARRPDDFYLSHAQAVKWWQHRVLLNVDAPMADRWMTILWYAGYAVHYEPVKTRRVRGFTNADKRADYEIIIKAERD